MKNKHRLFSKGSTSYRILVTTIVFIFLALSTFIPFMTISNANRIIGFVVLAIISIVYIVIVLNLIWEYLKIKYSHLLNDEDDK